MSAPADLTRLPRGDRDVAYAAFLHRWPAYAATMQLDLLRAREFQRLDAAGHVYLDYTGGGLYALPRLPHRRQLRVGLDAYLFNGVFSGSNARASRHSILNTAGGGECVPVIEEL